MKKKITVIVSIISIVFVMAFALAACNKETKPGYTALSAQADVFKELNSKTADVGIMDYTMANYLLSVDSAMAKNLTIADVEFEKEYYGIAFRKAADGKYNALTDLVNKTLSELKNSDYKTIADKYGISAATLDLVYSKPTGEADNTELDYIKNKGKIVIGFTLNAPMATKRRAVSTPTLQKRSLQKSARKSARQSRLNSNLSIGARRNPKWKQKPSTAYGTV